jgi:hypothetical protein
MDGLLVLSFALLKAVTPVFFAQLLLQLQAPQSAVANITLEFNETGTGEAAAAASNSTDFLGYVEHVW